MQMIGKEEGLEEMINIAIIMIGAHTLRQSEITTILN